MSHFSAPMSSNSSPLNLVRPLLGNVDLLEARELDLGPTWGLNPMLLVLLLDTDGHGDLANMDPDFPKTPHIAVWSLDER